MSYAIKEIAGTFKEARERKGLSQRELSALSGVHQYQISKFENGAVDLRLSSLIELARALDLELTLVPRKSVSAVNSIIRTSWPAESAVKSDWASWYKKLSDHFRDKPQTKEQRQILALLRDLQRFQLSEKQSDELRSNYKKLLSPSKTKDDEELARRWLFALTKLRNQLAYQSVDADRETVKPAYSLDEEGSDG